MSSLQLSLSKLRNSNCSTERDVGHTVSGGKEQGILCCFVGFDCRPHNSAHLGHVPCCYNRENLIKFSINILLDIFLIFLEDLKVKIVN